jgi:hypothetical protein
MGDLLEALREYLKRKRLIIYFIDLRFAENNLHLHSHELRILFEEV